MGQRAYTIFSAKSRPADRAFTVQVDAGNMLFLQNFG